ncbi:MAG TPA: hypothetical protein VFY42_00605, partial [Gemmatimonadales bacterium]|nr:hypothetical protein [Gemmatimonadales bacterium]
MLRRVPVGMHLFGVPLHRQNPRGTGPALDRFDQPILAPAARDKGRRQVFDGLVVDGVHRDGRGIERLCDPAARLNPDRMAARVARAGGTV